MSEQIYQLHAIVPADAAAEFSAAAFALCPEVGPNNCNIGLVPIDGPANATPTHREFEGPITDGQKDALFNAGMGSMPGCRWIRTDRERVLQKRYDDESPTPVVVSIDEFRAECGLKAYKARV